MSTYAYEFGPEGFKANEHFGKHGPVIVGDLLAIWQMQGERNPKYLIDGMKGNETPVGTFEKVVGAATFRNDMLLIATQEYVDSWNEKN